MLRRASIPTKEQGWLAYTLSMLAFSMAGFAALYAILRCKPGCRSTRRVLPAMSPGPGLQHGGQLRHQYQLAVLWRRDHHEPFQPDGGAHGAELRLGGDRHRHGAGADPRLRAVRRADRRQFLGRSDPLDALRAAAAGDHRGPRLRRDGPAADARRIGRGDHARRCAADHRARTDREPGSDQAARHQWRRLLQRQCRASVRKPDRALQLPEHRRHARRLGGARLRLRPDGRRPPPGLGLPRRHRDPADRRQPARSTGPRPTATRS